METMQALRKQIDEIDNSIIDLLAKRFAKVQEIGFVKKEQHIPVKDVKREEEKINMLVIKGQEKGISKEFIIQIWKNIFSESYRLEA